jgi:putative transposase
VIDVLSSHYPVALACRVLGCARSSHYYQSQAQDESDLRSAIDSLAAQWPTYGSRRITMELRRQGWRVNRKHVSRLMAEMGLKSKKKSKKKYTTDSDHPFPRYPNLVIDLEIVHPDQVWVADITYIALATEDVYLAIVMDVFTRSIRGWHLGRSLGGELTLTALRPALADHRPAIHHSDQGVQYAATAYVELLQAHGVAVSMTDIGAAWQNGYAERVIRTIKEEEVYLSDYQDYGDAYQQIGRLLTDVYTHKRIHSALGYLTPAEFQTAWDRRHTDQPVC